MNSTGTSSPSSPSRRRGRENETASQKLKREKAAERQRRKRERDKATSMGIVSFVPSPLPPSGPSHQPYSPSPPYVSRQRIEDSRLSEEEQLRRQRVRDSARERQRKHRAIVKLRKDRALAIEMGIPPESIDGLHFQPNGGFLPQDLQHAAEQAAATAAAAAIGLANTDASFPPGQQHGGQTFATTLLLSFSCAPLLKQHLLRTLNMTNEELVSLEPIIADAWDQWDRQRRMHYNPSLGPNGPHPFPLDPTPSNSASPFQPESANEFRARFHRSLAAPSPFQSTTTPAVPVSPPSVPDQIDPSLAAVSTKKEAAK